MKRIYYFFKKKFTREQADYVIVGDIHGEYDSFISLLDEFDFFTKNSKTIFILVGDVIDKGYDGLSILKFLRINSNRFIKILGNHENFVHKFLNGTVKISEDKQFLFDHMTSIKQYYNNKEFKELLNWYVDNSLPFFETEKFIVTHAPCQAKYLGKLDKLSLRNQRNYYIPHDSDLNIEKELDFIKKEKLNKYHLFGHIAFKRVLNCNKHIGIDLGCVYGGYLCGTYFKDNRVRHKKIKSKRFKFNKKLLEPFKK